MLQYQVRRRNLACRSSHSLWQSLERFHECGVSLPANRVTEGKEQTSSCHLSFSQPPPDAHLIPAAANLSADSFQTTVWCACTSKTSGNGPACPTFQLEREHHHHHHHCLRNRHTSSSSPDRPCLDLSMFVREDW